MRTFKHFPQDNSSFCPICGTNKDTECFLMPIDGTQDDKICEAQPIHVECADLTKFQYNKEHGLIYYKL